MINTSGYYTIHKMHTLVTITGPTCSGKSTLEGMLRERFQTQKIVSFTTRTPREGEKDGVDYYFIPKGTVDDFIAEGKIAEHITFNDNDYGILGSELEGKLYIGNTVVVVEPNGAKQLHKYCQENKINHLSVFLFNPPEVLAARFLDRFKKDSNAKALDYAVRLAGIFTDEQKWITAYPYDIIFSRFDKSNEDFVVNRIRDTIKDD